MPLRVLDRFLSVLPLRAAHRALAAQTIMFALVGFANVAVDLSVFFFALNVLTNSLVLANVASWIVAVSGSYVMNSYLTFAHESGRRLRLRNYAAFAASQVAGLFANTATLVMVATVLPIIGAKIVAILVAFVVNFTLARIFVFGRRRAPAAKE